MTNANPLFSSDDHFLRLSAVSALSVCLRRFSVNGCLWFSVQRDDERCET